MKTVEGLPVIADPSTSLTVRTAVAFALVAVSFGCSEPSEPASRNQGTTPAARNEPTPSPEAAAAKAESSPPQEATDPDALVDRGRAVYETNCIACHHPDPTQPGGLGPDVADASRELLQARVLRSEYPEGYEPKRDTQVMIALPHLEADIDALLAFLEQSRSE